MAGCSLFGIEKDAAKDEQPVAESDAKQSEAYKGLADIGTDNYPVINGSTANLPLLAGLYSEICGVSREDAEAKVKVSGTESAWNSLSDGGDGGADLIVAYEGMATTMEKAKNKGVIYDPIGRDGLVFLTGKDNPVDSLTPEQVRGIYSGEIRNWSDVGGNDEPIVAYQRNEDSGSQTMLEKLVMKGEKPMEAPSEIRLGEMSEMIKTLSEFDGNGNAIGYSVYYYADLMYAAPGLKMIKINDVAPSAETIASGEYGLTNDFYVAVRPGQADDSPAMHIREYLLSKDGAALMKRLGYVPLH
jgi:ABC-type phosphate transport system substrate-binding protein